MSQSETPSIQEAPDYFGVYHTLASTNLLELRLNPGGSLGGSFVLGGERLEVQGNIGPAGAIHGVLLDERAEVVTVFRAWPVADGLTLELDVPSPQPDFSEAETLQFVRSKTAHQQTDNTQEVEP